MMNKTEIYYFSGTGNSLYIARQLQGKIPESKLIPITKLLNNKTIDIDADSVGFVFPIHGMTIPVPVKKFLKKINLKSGKYIFAIATRAGTKCSAFNKINRMLKKQNKILNAHFILNMASNDPKFADYKPATKKELSEIETNINTRLYSIAKIIINKEISQEKDSGYLYNSNFLLELLVGAGMVYAEHSGGIDYYYADSNCNGCGACAKVCPSKKIVMTEDNPIWQNNVGCYYCYACINYCPKNASQIKSKWYMKSYTDKTQRYSHPYAKIDDIASQK